MNSSQMSVTGSRAEFITEDYPNIKYGRGGGCFISHAKAFLLFLLAVAVAVVAALLVFYLAPCPRGEYVTSLSLEEQEASASTDSVVSGHPEGGGKRLPSGILPSRYRVCLKTFFEGNFTFKGRVLIDFTVTNEYKESKILSLHAGSNLNISDGEVVLRKASSEQDGDYGCEMENRNVMHNHTEDEKGRVPIRGKTHENASEFYTLILGGDGLVVGSNYTLVMSFVGKLKDDLTGYYRSSFKDPMTGEKRWIASTQFESTHAREAFPCFDEPALKARFLVSLARPPSGFSLSNMRIRNSEPVTDGPAGWIWDQYEPSPPMSSYLLAFIVSPDKTSMQKLVLPRTDNSSVTNAVQNGENIEFSIWARPGFSNASDYALKFGIKVLNYYETYFGVKYPMTKMEMAAIPDFGAGAMENWGLVTYRESVLLYDPLKDSTSHKVEVAVTVAHELAHQWFGNLVTMRWWNDLWLNEGFATYVQYIGTDHVEPEWGMLERFVTEELQITLSMDSFHSTHAVSPGNSTTADSAAISELFDSVSYGKGSCLVRMLNHTLGEDTFRRGLNKYLIKWSYANAEQDDLWEALTLEATNSSKNSSVLPNGLTVKDIMDTWTLQEGYPVVTVTRNYNDGSARLSQERFLLISRRMGTPEDDAQPPPKEKWHVPITYTTATERAFQNTSPRLWLLSGEGDKELAAGSLPGNGMWVVFNVQETGFYRVNYDEQNWRLLTEALLGEGGDKKPNSEVRDVLPEVTRAQIIDDAFSLARGGRLNYTTALGVTRYLYREKRLVPWTAALGSLRFLDEVLVRTRYYGLLQRYMLKLLLPIYTSLQNKKDISSASEKLLRSMTMKWACHFDCPECIVRSQSLYKEWMNTTNPGDNNPVPLDDRKTVYCSSIKKGGLEEWQFLWDRFKESTNDSSAAEVMLPALSCTREPWIVTMLITETLEVEEEKRVIRLQDAHTVLRSMSRNPVAAPILFQYMKNNWENLHKRYGGSAILLGELVKAGLSGLSVSQDLIEVKDFRKRNARKFRFAMQDLDQAQEGLEDRVLWQEKNLKEVTNWLQRQLMEMKTT